MNPKIMIVDDHVAFRESLRSLIENDGGLDVVGETGDALTALLLARQQLPDLVLMDLGLPNMRGVDVMRRILSEHLAARVLPMSIEYDQRCVDDALKAGAWGFLMKDTPAGDMLRLIRRAACGEADSSRD